LQTDFLALYRGQTVSDARLVAVTADPVLVGRFIKGLGDEDVAEEPTATDPEPLRLIPGDDE
jgi:hypothetical protein